MKNIIKKIVVKILSFETRILLRRKKPEVIAITGSAGKTTTKNILVKLLSAEFEVYSPTEGYNTEIGAPLGLFGVDIPKKFTSVFGWIGVVMKCFWKSLTISEFPKRMVVEMGADAPGDIRYLAKIFRPKIGIILAVLPVHLAEFKTVIGVAKEKSELAKALPKDGTLYLNYDDKIVRDMATKTRARVVYFGTKNNEGFVAKDLKSDLSGMSFNLTRDGHKTKMGARLYGAQMIYPLLSSVAVALTEGVSTEKIKKALKSISPQKGRMNILEGKNGSIIIDDSYNAGPMSMCLALVFLGAQKGRRIALLGNMNELGDYEKEAHEEAGRKAAESADYIFTVGDKAEKYLLSSAIKAGFPKANVKSFTDSVLAGNYLREFIKEGDVILVKGSQNNVRLEKAVERFMKYPEKRREFLVRQSEFWQKRR